MTITKEVKVIISAVDQYSGSMLGFNTVAGGVVLAVGAITASMAAASIEAAKFATSLGIDVLKSASDFHDAMYNVEAVAQSFGTTGEQIDGILDRLTTKFPITGKQAGDALQSIAQLGMGAADELESMGNAVNILQIATGADLQTAIMGVSAVMNAWNMETEEADRVVNLFAATSFSTAADVSDMAEAMKYAGAAASLSGISIEETAALIGIFRNKGLEASQAGTTFRMTLAELYKETDRGREALAKYGLTYADLDPSIQSISDIIGKFAGKTISARDAVDIFGIRAQVMAGVINDGKEAFDGMVTAVTGTTAAYDAMEKKAGTWIVVQNQILGSTDQFKKAIAGDLLPELLKMIGTNENEGLRGAIVYMTTLEKTYGGLNDALEGGFGGVIDVLKDVFESSFGNVEELYNYLTLLAKGFADNLRIVAEWGGVWAKLGIESTNSLDLIQFALHSVNTSIAAVSFVVSGLHDVIALVMNGWIFGINSVEKGWADLQRIIILATLEIAKVMNDLPFIDMEDSIKSLEASYAAAEKKAKEAFDPEYVKYWSDDVAKAYYHAAESIEGMSAPIQAVKENTEGVGEAASEMATEISAAGKSSEELLAAINAMDSSGGMEKLAEDTKEVDAYTQLVGKNLVLVGDKLVESGQAAATAAQSIKAMGGDSKGIVEYVKDGARAWVDYGIGIQEAKDKTVDLSKSIEDMSDREFSLYTEKFKADLALIAQESKQTHDLVMSNLEWQAKLDIAEVEANAERVKAAFESIGQSVEATASATADMLGSFAGFEGGMSDKWYMQRIIEQQMDLQREALNMQKDLTEAEIALMKAKTDRIKSLSDEAMITVNGDGLKPHLEMIMWEIFEQIKVRATQEGLDKLLLGANA